MRLRRRWAASALALLMAVSMSSVSLPLAAASSHWEGELVGGLPPTKLLAGDDPIKMCKHKGDCPELEGVVYADINVSDQMPNGSEAVYTLHEEETGKLSDWIVCAYDGNAAPTKCNWHPMDHGKDQEIRLGSASYTGTVPANTTEMRLILEVDGPTGWELTLTAAS